MGHPSTTPAGIRASGTFDTTASAVYRAMLDNSTADLDEGPGRMESGDVYRSVRITGLDAIESELEVLARGLRSLDGAWGAYVRAPCIARSGHSGALCSPHHLTGATARHLPGVVSASLLPGGVAYRCPGLNYPRSGRGAVPRSVGFQG
ncbi:hypothetical protein ACWD4G_20305 [Streptomyces sp. NPDC002643]